MMRSVGGHSAQQRPHRIGKGHTTSEKSQEIISRAQRFRLLVRQDKAAENEPHQLRERMDALVRNEIKGLELVDVFSIPSPNSDLHKLAFQCSFRTPNEARLWVILATNDQISTNTRILTELLKQQMAPLEGEVICVPPKGMEDGIEPVVGRRSLAVGGGVEVVEMMGSAADWALEILRHLASNPRYRQLADMGIVGLNGFAIASTSQSLPNQPASPPSHESQVAPPHWWNPVRIYPEGSPEEKDDMQTGCDDVAVDDWLTPLDKKTKLNPSDSEDSLGDMAVESSDDDVPKGAQQKVPDKSAKKKPVLEAEKFDPLPNEPSEDFPKHNCKRPPMTECSEEEFLLDLVQFLQSHNKKRLVPAGGIKNFPVATFNGTKLDLFNLYKEVVLRGGIHVQNGINWKGQVFPALRNHTAGNRATAVSAVLKRHYKTYLMEYERGHDDVEGESCLLCNSGTEGDWVNCEVCKGWVHLGCDTRHGLASFSEYAKTGGREYSCPKCDQRDPSVKKK